jgi:hypothetical protein
LSGTSVWLISHQQLQLLLAVAFGQAQVHADHVDLLLVARHLQLAMQQAAFLGAGNRHVVVAVFHDRELRHDRVAVVALGVHHVLAIGELRPDAVREELVVRRLRPLLDLLAVVFVRAQHFLHEDDVGAHLAHGIAQLRQDEFAVEGREPLVDVHRHAPGSADQSQDLDRHAQVRPCA